MIMWLLMFLTLISKVDLTDMRELFAIASQDEEANIKLLRCSHGYTMDYNPVAYAYYAGATMTMANHTFWPLAKLNYFKEGKEKLEKVLKTYPKQVEIHFIRYAIQKKAPSFLDYNSNLNEDRRYILDHLKDTDWPEKYKKDVLEFLN